jgi:hypothetical protein
MPRYGVVLAGLGLGQLFVWAAFYYAFSSFLIPMQSEMGWGQTLLSGAFSLGLAVWALASLAVGAAIDRGRGPLVMTLGPVLGGLGFLVWSAAASPAVFYAAWTAIGLAMAMTLYEPAFTILTRLYPGRFRGGITALTLLGGFASTLAYPAAAWLIAALGWRLALAAIGLFLIAIVAPLHAMALRGGGGMAPDPEDEGGPARPARGLSLPEARATGAFWFLGAAFALYYFATAALWAHIVPVLAGKGFSAGAELQVLVWIGPAQVLGRLAFAAFGARVDARHLGLAVLSGLPLSLALLALATETWQLVLFALLFGACNGIVSLIRGSLLPAYFGRAALGRIAGALATAALAARAVAPLAAAWVLVRTGGYGPVLALLAGAGAAAVTALALARPPRR